MSHEVGNKEISYAPNNPVDIGLGGSINNTVLSFGYGYGFDFMREKKKGRTKSFDFQLHNYGRRFAIDLFVQKYHGFYIDDDDDRSVIVLCPDLRVRLYGASMQYVFNNDRFSYGAAFGQNEKQLKSAGSFLVGIGVNTSKIQSDSSFVYKEKSLIRNFQIGISGGYAYTWVIDKHWFMSGSITAGINFGSDKFSNMDNKLDVSPTVFPRISAGYNRKHWSLSFVTMANITSPSFSSDSSLNLYSGNMGMNYIYRIESVPLLSKLIR